MIIYDNLARKPEIFINRRSSIFTMFNGKIYLWHPWHLWSTCLTVRVLTLILDWTRQTGEVKPKNTIENSRCSETWLQRQKTLVFLYVFDSFLYVFVIVCVIIPWSPIRFFFWIPWISHAVNQKCHVKTIPLIAPFLWVGGFFTISKW